MKLGYSRTDYLEHNIKRPIQITLARKICNILITGKSGSGKSLSVCWYIYNMLHTKESLCYIADYKGGEEYELFETSPSYSSGDNAIELINQFYEFFCEVRKNKVKLTKHYSLIIEEYFGLLTALQMKNKKAATDLMNKIGEILAVGRGLNLGIVLVVQRPDAQLFSSGARENFQCITAFGRTSSEAFRMLGFSGELEENPTITYDSGQALVLIDGQEAPFEIIVPFIKNDTEMKRQILKHLDTQPALSSLIAACHRQADD